MGQHGRRAWRRERRGGTFGDDAEQLELAAVPGVDERVEEALEEADEHERLRLALGRDVRLGREDVLLEGRCDALAREHDREEDHVRIVVAVRRRRVSGCWSEGADGRVLFVAEVLAEVAHVDGPGGREGAALLFAVVFVRGLDERRVRAERIRREKVVRGVAVQRSASASERVDQSSIALVKALVVEEDMPARVVILESLHESERGLVGDARPALRVQGRRWARWDREEDVEGGHDGSEERWGRLDEAWRAILISRTSE